MSLDGEGPGPERGGVTRRVPGRVLVSGRARGRTLVLDEPLSFWGGVETESGRIVDRRHPQRGAVVSGRILVMPYGRGSSSSSSVLAESLRRGTAPAGLVLREPDPVLVLGALVAERLYGTTCPVIVLGRSAHDSLAADAEVAIDGDGVVTIHGHDPDEDDGAEDP